MRVVEVSPLQKEAAQFNIEISEKMGEPVREWTRRVAAAERRPDRVDPELEASDAVVLYLTGEG